MRAQIKKQQSREPKSLESQENNERTPVFYYEIAKLPKLTGTKRNKDGDWIDNNFPLTRYSTDIKCGIMRARKVLAYNEDGLPVISLQNTRQKTLVKNLLRRLQAKGVHVEDFSKTTYLVAETKDSIGEKPIPMVSFWREPPRLSLSSRMVYYWEEGNFQYWINTKSAFKVFLSRVIYKINLEDFLDKTLDVMPTAREERTVDNERCIEDNTPHAESTVLFMTEEGE